MFLSLHLFLTLNESMYSLYLRTLQFKFQYQSQSNQTLDHYIVQVRRFNMYNLWFRLVGYSKVQLDTERLVEKQNIVQRKIKLCEVTFKKCCGVIFQIQNIVTYMPFLSLRWSQFSESYASVTIFINGTRNRVYACKCKSTIHLLSAS